MWINTARATFIASVLTLAACIEDLKPPAASITDTMIEDGRAIAESNCASCHAIGRSGQSPNRDAPPFRIVLSNYKAEMLETELVEGMRVAHAPMPQFKFRPDGAGALIAYLRSIQARDPGEVLVEQRCARCHAIGREDVSPYPGAQPFRNLGRRWWRGQLRDALRTGILVEHDAAEPRVPPMKLKDQEIDLLLGYLDRIATQENPAPKAP